MLVQTFAFRWTTIRAGYLLSAAALALGALVLSVGTGSLAWAGDASAPAQHGAAPAASQPLLGEQSALAPLPRVASSAASPAERNAATRAFGKLPLAFIPNAGQTDHAVRYYAQGAGYSFYFTDHKAVLALQKGDRGQALQLRFLGANPNAEPKPVDRGASMVNYLAGSEHHADLPTYGRLIYRDLWPGIDMVFWGTSGKLRYEFHLRPGAKVSDIRLAYAGAEKISLGAGGALLLHTPLGTLKDARPHSFQRIDGRRVPVDSRYALAGDFYGFSVKDHDRRQPLVIDPSLTYSLSQEGSGADLGFGIALDSSGAAYITGHTDSTNYPTSAGAFDASANGEEEAFVTKINPAGSGTVYSTYLGGSGFDRGSDIAVDAAGAAYVTGDTDSANFPTTAGAFDTTFAGFEPGETDAFVTKLNPAGSGLAYSTYLGGSAPSHIAIDRGADIAVDSAGAAYVGGVAQSTNFPTTAGAFDTSGPGGFVTKVNPAGSGLTYSTYFPARVNSIALGTSGAVYLTGLAGSNLPTTPGAFDRTDNDGISNIGEAFVSKLNPAGSGLSYSTYLGGEAEDEGEEIALDSTGAAYVTGTTTSGDFPTTAGAFDRTIDPDGAVLCCFGDAFVTKLNPAGSGLAYSTYLGGSGDDFGHGIAVDSTRAAYVAGTTSSTNFPTTAGAFDRSWNGCGASDCENDGGPFIGDAFVTKLNPAGSGLGYSTYLGGSNDDSSFGIAVDSAGNAYDIAITFSTNFPTATSTANARAFAASANGDGDVVVTKQNTVVSQQGKISARGTVHTSQGPTIGFSAANNCDPPLSTRPSIVGTTAGGRIWSKSTVTQSSCTDTPPASPLGFDTQTGTATGTFGPSAPGGLNGQQGTLEWTYHDGGPDTVQFTLRNSANNIVFQAASQTPAPFRGSPGGVWTFGP